MKNAPFTIAVMISSSFFAVFGQSTSAPQFEVASVRLHASNEPTRIGVRISGNRVSGIASLKQFILTAYDLQPYQVVGGPNWIDLDRYELAAKVPGESNVSLEQARPYLQALLADRFELKAHRETKDIPVYALVVAKNGLKLKESAADGTSQTSLPSVQASTMHVTTGKATMERLAKILSSYAGRPVKDDTGLMGSYQINLEWTPDSVAPDSAAEAPLLVTAVQEQLGLRLEPRKAPMEVLVIDHAEKPSGN
jgi:uncharacterized protein (TIGR03435 family)